MRHWLFIIRKVALLGLVVSGLMFFGCRPEKTNNGFSKKDNYYYKLLSIGDGKIKPDTSDVLWIDASCLTLKDSVFWDTKHNAFQSFFVKQNTYSFTKHLFSLAEGDSVQFLVQPEVLFKEVFGYSKVAFFSEKDSAVKFSAKILRIISPDEYAQLTDSLRVMAEGRQNEEYGQINHYVTQSFQEPLQFSVNAFLQVTRPSAGDSIKRGDKVSISYKGYFLDGRLADFTPEGKPFEVSIGQEGQLIDGLRLALYHLKKGEKAKIILPSRLAFGSQGSSNGSIPPHTPLLYEVEILDTKN